MSKYRFKIKEEFIRDGLWDEKYNCPDTWALSEEMNKYLGKDVPDECIVYCDKNESFYFDGWMFGNTDYVLKEQQKYFDDLSQHIGRYIKALIDNPHAGIGVKKGDIGKIINNYQADFLNHKGYHCTQALDKDHLGTKYELLPEDYSPKQKTTPEKKEPNVEFIPGKWYKWYQKNHGNYHYGKVKEINLETDTLVVIPWIIQCDEYRCSGTFDLSKAEQIQEISIEEIQEFLPKNHSDKISKPFNDRVECTEFKEGDYIVITDKFDSYSKDFVSNHIYKQRKDSTYLCPEYDSLLSKTNGWIKYTRNNSHNWRYATQEEIQEYERRGKPYDVTELQKKELSMKEIQEECKKRFPIGCTLISVNGSSKNIVLKQDHTTYTIVDNMIYAGNGQGYLYFDGKYATLVSLPKENITEIPEYVECVIYDSKSNEKIFNTNIDKSISEINSWKDILIKYGRLEDGSFKISNKEAYEKQKSQLKDSEELTTKIIMGNDPCKGTTSSIFTHDEIKQFPSISSDYWKNVPTFVEKEFDIYGPTPDID